MAYKRKLKQSWEKYLPGRLGKSVNNLRNMLFAECDTPPSLWVTTALEAILQMGYSVAEPDMKELYHKITGRSIVHSWKETINQAHKADPAVSDGFKHAVFRSAEWADMYVWYAFLAGVAEDGLYDWTSQVFKFANCGEQTGGHILSRWVGSATGCGYWNGTVFTETTKDGDWDVGTTDIWIPPHHSGIIAFHGNPTTFWGEPVSEATRIRIDETGELLASGGNLPDADGNFKPTSILYARYTNLSNEYRHMVWESYVETTHDHYNEVFRWNVGGYVGIQSR